MNMNWKSFGLLARIMRQIQSRGQGRQTPPVQIPGEGDERDIQVLVAEGNDEAAVRLIFDLVMVPQDRVGERYDILCKLGERYAFLATERERQRERVMQEGVAYVWTEVVEHFLSVSEDTQVGLLPLRPLDPQTREMFNETVRYLSAAIDLNPQAARAYASRGLVYTAMGEFPAAITDYTAAIPLAFSPQEEARLHYLRGITCMLQGDGNAGIGDFRRAVELDDQQISYQEALFRAERESGQGS